jgi:hypothetical protein
VQLTTDDGEIVNSPVWSSYTWDLTITDPTVAADVDSPDTPGHTEADQERVMLGGIDWSAKPSG